jgi:hypothetical protein
MEHCTEKIFSTTHRKGFILMKARNACQQMGHEGLDAEGQRKHSRSNTGRRAHDLKLTLRLLGRFTDPNTRRHRT